MSAARTILITGCSSGIGYGAAVQLRQRGYRVFATARKEEDLARLVHEGFDAVPLELSDSASIARAVEQVLQRTGGTLDALFNNAAYGQPGAVEDLRRDVLRAQFEANLFGTLELTNQIIPVMRRQGHGRLVFTSSVLGLVAMPYRGAYNASKFALEGLIDTLRLELHGSGLHVSLIEPGPIKSRFRANAYAMYQKNIDREHSAHREIYVGLERRLTKTGATSAFTREPDAVVQRLIDALESPRPKQRYYVTLPTFFFAAIRRVLPLPLIDRILLAVSHNEHR